MYLESFLLPSKETEEKLLKTRMWENAGPFGYVENAYPYGIFPPKGLFQLDFERVTILYGGNGSGKSTLLNLIASALKLKRISPPNSGEMWDLFAAACQIRMTKDEDGEGEGEGKFCRLPSHSRILTSDDVFDFMLAMRSQNDQVRENVESERQEWFHRREIPVRMQSMEDYENVRKQALICRKSLSRRQYLRETAGKEWKLGSNGETALEFFDSHLKEGALYCLDEPENSLAPKFQLELLQILSGLARWGRCQFILATHSPFLLSLPGARIYDLDSRPVTLRKWWELENVRTCFRFFDENRHFFEDGK